MYFASTIRTPYVSSLYGLGICRAFSNCSFYQTNRQAKHGMPTRHQFTNLPLFIAFSFLGLTRAALEGPISNLRDRVADIDGSQPLAVLEGTIANIRYRVGDVDRGGQASAAKEGILANLRDIVADIDGGQTRAATEGRTANLRYRVGDVDRGQTSAAREGPISNLRDRVGDVD